MSSTVSKEDPIDANSDSIALTRSPNLLLIQNTPKGRGIFASRSIPSGSIIEISPVLVLSPEENAQYIEKTVLWHYTYNWTTTSASGAKVKTQAVVLGLGSMFNHSRYNQNVGWERDLQREVIIYRAVRNIQKGDELCISYGDRLTFVDVDATEKGEEVKEDDGMEVLGIEVD